MIIFDKWGFKMSLVDKLTKDMIKAMKARDKVTLSEIRQLKAELVNKKIAVGHDLSDDEALAVVSHEAKQHRESIEDFKKGNRDDLVKQQEAELKVIKNYLPKPMSPDDVKKVVENIIKTVHASSMKDFGKVMGMSMSKLKGRADGNAVNKFAKQILNK